MAEKIYTYKFIAEVPENKFGISSKNSDVGLSDSVQSNVNEASTFENIIKAPKTLKKNIKGLSSGAKLKGAMGVLAGSTTSMIIGLANTQYKRTGKKTSQFEFDNTMKTIKGINVPGRLLERIDYSVEMASQQKEAKRMSDLGATDIYKTIGGQKR